MKKKTCFVISPIGDKDSDVRKLANDLFDLIIEPALEKFDFEIIRADKITSTSSITADIISHVQNADLCIVDLTGRNANVMYECGRRHETGKPFIMVAQEGEKLPFDINTIRTFFYNTKDGRAIREISKIIQDVVKNLIADGFGAQTSGESLTNISDTLRRIERKLDETVVNNLTIKNIQVDEDENLDIFKSLEPDEAYAYALKINDRKLASRIFPHVISRIKNIETALIYSIPIADISELAANILEDNLSKINPEEKMDSYLRGYRHLMSFWLSSGLAKQKMEKAEELMNFFLPFARNSEDKASIMNQLSRIYYSAPDYEKGLLYAEEIVKLWKDDTAYWYNLALICTAKVVNKVDRAEEAINEMLSLGTKNSDHLELAITFFRENGKREEANTLLNELAEINKYKARMLQED